ncbi:ferredoxin-NADP reductase [Halopolyspora algeriensis]|uniref:Ferredoxin-NADP reductase n=1 Tax=Halopolyspora algeriensis TaxID=1500506 RepID=A0A368VUZ8_9ACTN|nr:fatty acid desaturase [Halopolyspora algeriensis]RCW44488.1 ferredoxin-NADP reductase [Halopolyspora algeriensis]TQM55849.1 ferredoxin-NADP reductase [Halopolyspora algeriensis]
MSIAEEGTAAGPVLSEAEAQAVRRGVPNPGIALPRAAVPTVVLFVATAGLWALATWLVLGGFGRWWLLLSIPLHALVTFAMFTVLHESIHHAAGRWRWVNQLLGRLSMPFVAAWGAFPMLRYIHIEHHRNTNEDIHTDPDAWSEHGPAWQLPLRWITMDAWYLRFYLPRLPRRPRGELAEDAAVLTAVVAGTIAAVVTGHLWELAVIYLIPQRIGLGVLAWWFDWLPHHDLGVTARNNRFRATRVRVGWEWLFNPLMFYQNYHLVHHIHPTIPFYRYVQAWQRTEQDYLDRNVPIATAWGRELSPSEYRAWRRITESFDHDEVSEPEDGRARVRFHRLRVAEVRRLTPQAVSVTFDVPDRLRDTFRFTPGQHVAVRTEIDGQEVRRTYSICAAADSGVLRIAVKQVDGGIFSEYANTRLQPGDELDVLPPSGPFTLLPQPTAGRHIAAIAAGSGITPVISILASTLDAEPDSRATLLYANRDADSTMFADELTMLVRQFEGRLRILHFHSRVSEASNDAAGSHEHTIPARLDADRLRAQLGRQPGLAGADEWFLCGPAGLVDQAREVLDAHRVPAERVHRELFTAATGQAAVDGLEEVVPATVTVTLDGERTHVAAEAGESLLEAGLRAGIDAPYSCTGGACATCRATLRSGTVHMEQNHVLSEQDIDNGWVLTCQSRPTSSRIEIDYDR